MRVLYVDDDRVNTLLFAEVARLAEGVTVAFAGSGEEALQTLASAGADLLVLDLHLPDLDGYTLLPRLRERAGRRLPAYLCSADDPALVQGDALRAGFDGCWTKPLDVAQVLTVLRAHAQPRP